MISLPLKNIREDNPRDFLAALGLLRLASLDDPKATLHWQRGDRFPHLNTTSPLPKDWGKTMIDLLKDAAKNNDCILSIGKICTKDGNNIPTLFSILRPTVPPQKSSFAHQINQFFLPSITSQKWDINHRSHLFIESSSRAVFGGLRKALAGKSSDLLAEALHPKANLQQSLGSTPRLNPAENIDGAFTGHDPEKLALGDYALLNVAALLGTSFFPVVDASSGRRTIGFYPCRGALGKFVWPIWETPLDSASIELLVGFDFVSSEKKKSPPWPDGVTAVWQSKQVFRSNNTYFSATQLLSP